MPRDVSNASCVPYYVEEVSDPVLDRDKRAADAMEALAAGEKDQVKQGGKYVSRRRRSLLAELSAADPPRHMLTPEELAWVSDAMGGAELSTPKVLYDMDDDLKHSATTWLDSCARHTLKGGREMLVVVLELNTGKKVVGTTEVGWNTVGRCRLKRVGTGVATALFQRLKLALKYDEPLSSFAFNFDLRRYKTAKAGHRDDHHAALYEVTGRAAAHA